MSGPSHVHEAKLTDYSGDHYYRFHCKIAISHIGYICMWYAWLLNTNWIQST